MKNKVCAPKSEDERLKILRDEIELFENLILSREVAEIISHEIRNPMTTVRGFLQMFMQKPSLAQNQDYLQMMIEELDELNSTISIFLAVSKGVEHQKELWNLNRIIESISPLIQTIAREEEKVFLTDLQQIPDLFLNMKEIRHLILKMSRNSYQAMNRNGILTISTRCEEESIILEIKDQGKGIEPEVLERLGTPFLTTKEMGKGLGLAVCYRIAKRHGASIEVNSSKEGTIFRIRFKIAG